MANNVNFVIRFGDVPIYGDTLINLVRKNYNVSDTIGVDPSPVFSGKNEYSLNIKDDEEIYHLYIIVNREDSTVYSLEGVGVPRYMVNSLINILN